jgi:hypothetical protein
MGLSGVAIGTYHSQYRPLSAIRYLDVNPLPTRYTLFITLTAIDKTNAIESPGAITKVILLRILNRGRSEGQAVCSKRRRSPY